MKPIVGDYLVATSRVSGVPIEELTSASRASNVVTWRQRGIYLARRMTQQPLKIVAEAFTRNISTCFTSCRAVEADLLGDKATKLALGRIAVEAQAIAAARNQTRAA